jgi:Glycosyl hydrolases family 16
MSDATPGPDLFWKLNMAADGQSAEPGWGAIQPSDLPSLVTPVPVITPVVPPAPVPVVTPVPAAGFYDDFSQTAPGSLPDPSKWAIAENSQDPTGGSQVYTRDPAVVGVQAGAGAGGSNALVFQVQAFGGTQLQQTGAGEDTITPVQGGYLSARITTFPEPAGNDILWSWMRPGFRQFSATYGTFTVVAKISPAAGFWPAIWCYGTDKRWPYGEIDLAENFGGSPLSKTQLGLAYFNVFGLACTGDYSGAGYEGTQAEMNASPAPVADGEFHTYQMQLDAAYDQAVFTMDGVPYVNSPVTRAGWLAAQADRGHPSAIWPYGPDTPLGIVLNVAVGGPGTVGGGLVPFPPASTQLPATVMVIDSVSWTVP